MCIQARTKGCNTMFKINRTATLRLATVVLATSMLVGAAPASAAQANGSDLGFSPRLAKTAPVAKFTVAAPAADTAMTTAATMASAPVKALATTTSTTVKAATTTTAGTTKRSGTDETAKAKAILAGLIAKYPILQGTTVTFGDARGYQAIALYKSGRIIINPAHTATLSRILDHEVWHIIDWRDNGVIDWGENIPAH